MTGEETIPTMGCFAPAVRILHFSNRHVHVAPAYRLQMARPALGPDADIVVLDNDWQMVVVTARGQWQHGARAS